jgi:hypothetical protein
VTRKGFYPYEYTDCWEKLDETALPSIDNFYNTLNEEHINIEYYEHVKSGWGRFNCTTLGEYSYCYLKVDMVLLVDVFENFRDIMFEDVWGESELLLYCDRNVVRLTCSNTQRMS